MDLLTTSPLIKPARDIYSVSRLTREARLLLESGFPMIWLSGEISNLARPASGHLYFCLKDGEAQVRCAFFRNQMRAALSCTPKDGISVLVRARVSLYEGRGEFQLIVEQMEDAGLGALHRKFEALKARLAQEGLLDLKHKKPLPVLPKRIGLITSPSGAAVRDILATLNRRFPVIAVLIYPVPVQGEGAAEKIAAAIQLASQRKECDALIIARGGGSLEDLWPFNEEAVARAIFACAIPIVSGVGHEVDFTIADLVADVRAPTPTAAAEMLSPEQAKWMAQLRQQDLRLVRLMQQRMSESQQRLDWLSARLIRPDEFIRMMQQRLRGLAKRLRFGKSAVLNKASALLAAKQARLYARSPLTRLQTLRLRCRHDQEKLIAAGRNKIRHCRQHLQQAAQGLNTLSPLATLERGYAILQREDATLVRSADQVKPGERLQARLRDGSLACRVEKVNNNDGQ